MQALRYQIELEERVLASGREGDPNTLVTRPFLPGSLLRGAFIGQYLAGKEGYDAVDLAADKEVTRPLFFDASVRYLNGYLVDEDGAPPCRMLPTPRSWHQKKEARREVWDFAGGEPLDGPWSSPFQALKNPFCTMPPPGVERPENVWFEAPGQILKTHIQRATDAKRPTRESGAIYRYESLAAGQTFEAYVLCDDPGDADRLIQAIGESAWKDGGVQLQLGKARSVQGKACAKRLNVWDSDDKGPWSEGEAARDTLDPDARFQPLSQDGVSDFLVVTLLSDVLARDEEGQFAAGPGAVTASLNRTLEAMGESTAAFPAPERVYLRAAHAGGFNREWGLHLPEADAVAMGSVLVYNYPGLGVDVLRELEWRGIGARRAEGFGRVAFNLHGGYETFFRKEKGWKPSPAPHELHDGQESHDLAGDMAERMFRKRLNLALTEAVTVAVSHHSLSDAQALRSQLGGLRVLLQRALGMSPKEGRSLLLEYLDDVNDRQAARSRFEGVLVNKGAGDAESLLDWVRGRVEDGKGIDPRKASLWNDLGVTLSKRPSVGSVQAEITDQLVHIYNLRFVHDVLARAGRDAQETN